MSSTDSTTLPLALQPEPRSILLLLPSRLGDMVLATPFVDTLFRRFPGARITLLVSRELLPLLEGGPWAENCRTWAPRGTAGETPAQQRELLAGLRSERFDLGIVLSDSLRSAWICWRSGARRRVGFDRQGRRLLLTDPLRPPNRVAGGFAPMPRVDYYAALARALGCPHPGDRFRLHTTARCDRALRQRLQREGIAERQPLVVLCPGGGAGPAGCWDPRRYAEVADHLVRRRGAAVALCAAAGEVPQAQAVRRAMQTSAALLDDPCLDAGELKSLIAGADLWLGGDSGQRQVARAFGIPRVAVFGPTDPHWTETGHGGETLVRVAVPCGPCGRKRCPYEEQICMTRITVERVARACESALAARGPRS
jgi:heptosyltransferase-2